MQARLLRNGELDDAGTQEDLRRVGSTMDASDEKMVVTGVRAMPYWYVADAGDGLSETSAAPMRQFISHGGGCPVSSWADHVGLTRQEDSARLKESKSNSQDAMAPLTRAKNLLTNRFRNAAQSMLGFGSGGIFSVRSGRQGAYVGFRSQRLMWIDVAAGPQSLGVAQGRSSSTSNPWSSSTVPRLDLGSWGLMGRANTRFRSAQTIHPVGPGIMVPRGVDRGAALAASAAFQG